jgi:apolipoprotein N-acyltransferase
MNKKEILLASISGLLMPLAFPNFNLSFIAWIGLIPLITAVFKNSPAKGFLLSTITGTIFHFGLVYWVTVSMTSYGKLPLAVSILVLILFAFVLSIFISIPICLSCYVKKHLNFSFLLTLPLFWTASEYIKSWFLTGFPWENLGYSQFNVLPVIQIADLTGVYGITFIIVFANCTLFCLLNALTTDKKIPYRELSALILLIVITLLYGQNRLNYIDKNQGSPIKISLVQPNIPQDVKWDPEYLTKTLEKLDHLSLKSSPDKPDLVIWPESATPFFFQTDDLHRKTVEKIVKKINAYLLLGSPSWEKASGKTKFFNSAFLISPENNITGKYNKIHLVPYGEYIPLKLLFPFIDKMVEGIGDFASGSTVKNLSIPSSPFAAIICYEIIFPDLVRRFVKEGAGFIVNITNDAWFGATSAPYQHLSMCSFRAVENRRYVVRAANTGISAFISPDGQIFKQTKIFTDDSLTAMIHKRTDKTFYSLYGDMFAFICTFLSLLFIYMARRKKSKNT